MWIYKNVFTAVQKDRVICGVEWFYGKDVPTCVLMSGRSDELYKSQIGFTNTDVLPPHHNVKTTWYLNKTDMQVMADIESFVKWLFGKFRLICSFR